jgi:hypothetical protein
MLTSMYCDINTMEVKELSEKHLAMTRHVYIKVYRHLQP